MPRSQSPEWPASGGRGEPGALRLTAAASGVRAPRKRQRGQRTQRPREGAARTQGCAPRPQRRHPRQQRQQAAATQPSGDGETSETRQARTVEGPSDACHAAGEPQRRSAERGNPTSGQTLDTSPMNFPAPADAERRERSGAFEGQEGGAEEPLSNGRSSGLRGDVLEMVARSRDYAGHQRTVPSDAESHRR